MSFAFSPDSRTLAVGHLDHRLRFWDLQANEDSALKTKLGGPIFSIAFRNDGKQLAFGTGQGTVILWDLEANKEAGRFRLELQREKVHVDVKSLAFAPDGKSLAIGMEVFTGQDREVQLWDLKEKKVTATLLDCKGSPNDLAFVPEGKLVVMVQGIVRVCDATTLAVIRKFEQREDKERILSSAVSRDGKTLATICDDKKLRVWNLATGELTKVWPVSAAYHRHAGFPLAFSPDGTYVAFGAQNNLHVYDIDTGKEGKRERDGDGFISRVVFSPDGSLLALHGYHGPRILETKNLKAQLKP